MNPLSIILSLASAGLAVLLVLVWQSDHDAANEEPRALIAQINKLTTKNKDLEAKLALHNRSLEDRAKGKSTPSPYSGSFQGQAELNKDNKTIELNNAQITRLNDKINPNTAVDATSLAEQEITTSALDAAASATTTPAPSTEPSKTSNLSQAVLDRRFKLISNSKVYATIKHVEPSEFGESILAQLSPDISISEGSTLSVRRNNTILGKLKIITITAYDGLGDVASLQPDPSEINSAEFQSQIGDELILTPHWE